MDAIGKLRSVYKNILRLEYQNKRTDIVDNIDFNALNVNKKSEIDLFSEFYLKQNNIELDNIRLDIVNNVIKECIDKDL